MSTNINDPIKMIPGIKYPRKSYSENGFWGKGLILWCIICKFCFMIDKNVSANL